MGTVKKFEDLGIWQLARKLLNHIYDDFNKCKDYNLKNQIISAGLSITNNIAEGFGRESDKEFKQFLTIAKGSCEEVKSMYYTAEDLKYIITDIAEERRNRIFVLQIKISNFIFYLKKINTA